MKRERAHVIVLLFAVALSYAGIFCVSAKVMPTWLGPIFPLVAFIAGCVLTATGPLLTDRIFGLIGALPGSAFLLLWLKTILLGN